ncbi:hypothetical protein ACFL6N_01310 [Thermodesulfobacteriota bacterium]
MTIFILSLTFLMGGCASAKRTVWDNVFYSSARPEIKIQIDRSFKYKTAEKKTIIGEFNTPESAGPMIDLESYVFHGTDNTIPTNIEIKIIKLDDMIYRNNDGIIRPFKNMRVNNTLYQGKLNPSPNLYYFIFPVKIHGKNKTILNEANLLPGESKCLLIKLIGKNHGQKTRFQIKYDEDITNIFDGRYACRDWRNMDILTEEQNVYLEGFIERAETAITVLN